ncbi:glyoxalase superfamily protein [Halobacillus sp. HZG1]|uniref:glyoxalase superfamily protein n=1 Tax=Halobacillus sp. HZG1 TaxID=3111769 RepID=UPI002DB6E916|nr:glyoxalase superfamily protein [Halobacillus sp. HZG1]MEC3885809.1 glyoxalase superfamily protein [Halobacillus sp. HZG1]
MQKVIPTLKISNEEKSQAFYVEGLGFRVDWEHRFEPGYPVFMQISRGEDLLYLTAHEGDCQPGGLVHILVEDVDRFYETLPQEKLDVNPPYEMIEGIRMLSITDPDGNELRFMNMKK